MPFESLIDCKHCQTTGTCKNGSDAKTSCGRCIGHWRGHWWSKLGGEAGLVCSVCYGRGVVEPGPLKWDRRFPFFLSAGLVSLGFILLFSAHLAHIDPNNALTFVGTLLGSITGYYFAGERSRSTASAESTKGDSPANDKKSTGPRAQDLDADHTAEEPPNAEV